VPTFEQFVAALRDPSLRAGIGLVIEDSDAAALLTRQDWASDYYTRWLALFPEAAAAAAAPGASAPAPVPVSATAFAPQESAASPFGPPPTPWATPNRVSRIPSAAKVPLIVGGSLLGVILLVAIGLGVYRQVVLSAASSPTTSRSTTPADPSPTAKDNAVFYHGLTHSEYEVLEAVLAPQGRTLEQAVQGGATDAQLRTTFDKLSPSLTAGCAQAATVPGGFDDPRFRKSFIAGYEATQKATDDQAGVVFDAFAEYCKSS
jgi:hypothetical protein